MEAYLKAIHAKTGKTMDDIRAMTAGMGFEMQRDALAWAKSELGLGHGHAMLVAKLIFEPGALEKSDETRIEGQYGGKKAHWRPLYERMWAEVRTLGPDVATDASDAYVSFVRNGKKFAIAQPSTADRFDVGIKLKGEPAAGRFEEAGKWNPMVTHRVRVTDPAQVDDELMGWIAKAYAAVK